MTEVVSDVERYQSAIEAKSREVSPECEARGCLIKATLDPPSIAFWILHGDPDMGRAKAICVSERQPVDWARVRDMFVETHEWLDRGGQDEGEENQTAEHADVVNR